MNNNLENDKYYINSENNKAISFNSENLKSNPPIFPPPLSQSLPPLTTTSTSALRNSFSTNNFANNVTDIDSGDKKFDSNSLKSNGFERMEEPWTHDNENLILAWREHVNSMSKLHETQGKILRKKNLYLGVPTYIIPSLMTFISVVLSEMSKDLNCQQIQDYSTGYNIANAAMFFISSTLSLFYTIYDLGTQSALHYQYSSRYYDLVIRIDSELARSRRFRANADIFIVEMRCCIDNLNQSSPVF